MKYTLLVLLLLAETCVFGQRYWIATTSTNWNNTANWSTSSGGAGGASVPGSSDLAVFNGNGGRNGNCTLDIAPIVAGITVNGYTGTINLSGFSLTISGPSNNTFTTGTITNSGASASVAFNTSGNTTFNGTLFIADISGSTGTVLFSGSVFNNPVSITKTGSSNDVGTGNNTFNSSLTIQNSSTGQLRLATTNPDTYAGTFNIIINNTGAVYPSYTSATASQYSQNINITYNSIGLVTFGSNGGRSNLASGKTINILSPGAGGSGNLTLNYFTASTTTQSITLSGNSSASLNINNSSFGGILNVTAPSINLSASTFSGNTNLTKNGTPTDNSTGGNTFGGTLTATNSGSGEFNLANTNPDIYNGNVTLNNTGTSRMQIGVNSAGNIITGTLTINHGGATAGINTILARNVGSSVTINGGVILNCTNTDTSSGIILANDGNVNINGNVTVFSSNGRGILFGAASGAVNLGNSYSISDGGAGAFTTGVLSIINFTQIGSTPQSLNLSGTSSLILGPSTSFGGNVNFISSQVYLNGATFSGTSYIEKNGATNNQGSGNNTFIGNTTIVNSGSAVLRTSGGNIFSGTTSITNSGSADILLELTSGNTYSGNVIITNSGTSNVRMAYAGATTFGGNITFNSTGGAGIIFCESASATATLADFKTVSAGTFSIGSLILQRFTQGTSSNNTLQTLLLNGTGLLQLGPSSTFNGDVNFKSPQMYLSNSYFRGVSYLEKSGATDNYSAGGNTFNGTATIVDSGSGYFAMCNSQPDIFNSDVTVNNFGSNAIFMANNVAGNQFKGNIIVNATSGNGIYFSNNATGSSSQDAGYGISIGSSGFLSGELRIKQFTQNGSAPINMAVPNTYTSAIRIGPGTTLGGNVNISFPQVYLDGATYTGTATIEKNGATDNGGNGGNIFNATTVINNSGSGYLLTGNTNADQFNASTTFNNTGSYRILFAQNHTNQTTTFASDVTLNSNKSGGVDGWSFFYGEGSNVSVSFAGNLTINCQGTLPSNIRILQGAGSSATYNGTVTINATNSNGATNVYFGTNGTSIYNGNIVVGNSGGINGITFNYSSSASSTLSDPFTITNTAFTSGSLLLQRFTQGTSPTNTPQNIALTGTAILQSTSSTFNGDVNFKSPQIYIQGSTFNGLSNFEKTGASDNYSNGGNTFNGISTITDSGSGYFAMAQTAPDIFNSDVTVNNFGTNIVYMANNVSGNQFNGNITVNSTVGNGIYFSNNTTGFSTQAANGTISIGSSGFQSGELRIKRLTQLGSGSTTLVVPNTFTSILRIGPGTTLGGNVSISFPQVYLDGATYNGFASIEKNGASNNQGIGNNVFASGVTITNSSSSGYLWTNGNNTFNGTTTISNSGSAQILLELNIGSIYNGDVTFSNTGTSYIRVAYNGATSFNGNIIANSTNGTGVAFCENTAATAALVDGKTISSTTFTTGSLILQRFTQGTAPNNTPQTLTLSNTALLQLGSSSAFNGDVNFSAGQILLNGAIFNGVTSIQKTGAIDNSSNGGNTFNGITTITDSGSGAFVFGNGNPDQFNAFTTFNDLGGRRIAIANTGAATTSFASDVILNANNTSGSDTWSFLIGEGNNTNVIFNGNLTINCQGSIQSNIRFMNGNGSSVIFSGNVTINSTNSNSSTIIYMGGNGTSTYNGNIVVGNSGAAAGIIFNNGASATSTMADGKTISNTTFSSGSLILQRFTQGTVPNNTPQTLSLSNTALLQVGPSSAFNGDINFSAGQVYLNGATYNGLATIQKTGATDNYSSGGNIFNKVTTITNSGSGAFIFGNGNPDQFNAVTTFNDIGSYRIYLAHNNGATPSTFAANVTLNANKSAAGDAWSFFISENNNTSAVFNGNLTINCQGSIQSNMRTVNGTGSTVIYNGTVTINSTNTNASTVIQMGSVGTSTYNGNVIVGNSGGTSGVVFNNSASATSTMADGKTITNTSFPSGSLILQRFTQGTTGNNTAQSLTLTGTAVLQVGPTSTFNGDVTFKSPQLYLNGATFAYTSYLEKTGATDNNSVGGNVFTGASTLVDSGTGYLLMANNQPDIFNGNLTINNFGSNIVHMAYNVSGNQFNGNVIVNATSGNGIYFSNGGAGFSTLTNGNISIGGSGFTNGELRIYRLTQSNSAAVTNLTLTGTATFRTGQASVWNGNIAATAPILFLDGAAFNGATNSFTKNGTSTDASAGGNTFAAGTNTTFTNTNTGIFRFANTTGDAFNGSVAFVQSSGTIQPAYANTSTSGGDITVNSSTSITFGANGGILTFNGSASQAINKAGSAIPVFAKIVMNKTGAVTTNTVTLNTIANINTSATFTSGVITSSTTNYINFIAGSSVSGGSNSSYVDGPVRKVGNTAFTFPVGNSGIYRNIAISAPGTATDHFTAQYFFATQAYGGKSTWDPSFQTLSSCEYWILNRTNGVSNVTVTLSWNSPDCQGTYITTPANLRVARWTGTAWATQGNGGTTGNATTGTIVSSGTVNSFSPFTLASTTTTNPLPIELTDFTAELLGNDVQLNWITASEVNNASFTLERSTNAAEFVSIASIKGAGTKQTPSNYEYLDINPASSVLYYRLKQTDYNGNISLSNVIRVAFGEVSELIIYPVPVKVGETLHLNYTGYYEIFNSLGESVLQTAKTNAIKINSLTPGIYIIRADKGYTKKIVVE